MEPLDLARALLAKNRLVGAYLPHELFGDPSWDILLDLYVAREEKRWISTSSACLAGGVPRSTGLRHLKRLQDIGLVETARWRSDTRIVNVALSDSAHETLTRLLIRFAEILQPARSNGRMAEGEAARI